MASNNSTVVTMTADATVSAGYCVARTSTGTQTCDTQTSAGAAILGITEAGGAAGAIAVIVSGPAKAAAGADIAAGTAALQCDATGRLIAAASGDVVVAELTGLRPSGGFAAGDIIDVVVSSGRILP